jgi:hypothetical protein
MLSRTTRTGALVTGACVLTAIFVAAAAAARTAETRACSATPVNGRAPLGVPYDLYGNGRLAVSTEGLILATERTLNPNGTISEKFGWWAAPTTMGDLRISGKRFDRAIQRTVRTHISGGLDPNVPSGIRFWSTIVTFPTRGCWRLTGKLGAARLTFVVIVRKPRAGESSLR